ncbi:MAG: hypothetical protein MUF51_09830, partial [Vicinamibacteria bacterium]|nr:hypothetical protein [Vicinamibacteria bacterium]
MLIAMMGIASWVEAADRYVGLSGGTVDPSDIKMAPAFALDVRQTVTNGFVVIPDFGYWKRANMYGDGSTDLTDMSAGILVVKALRKNRPRLQTYIGGGVAVHVLSTKSVSSE